MSLAHVFGWILGSLHNIPGNHARQRCLSIVRGDSTSYGLSERTISYGILNCLTVRLSTVTWSGCHQTADPCYIFFSLFWYIANDGNINIASSHWWRLNMVTFQSAIHGEEEV